MKIKRDQVSGLAIVAIGLFFLYLTLQFKKPFSPSYPGPMLMPFIAEFGLIVCGLGIFLQGCKQKSEDKVFLNKEGFLRFVISFAILCLYIFAMKYLGFLLVTPFVLFGITCYFAKASKIAVKIPTVIIFSIVVTGVLYGMYVPLFGMTLPSGLLFG